MKIKGYLFKKVLIIYLMVLLTLGTTAPQNFVFASEDSPTNPVHQYEFKESIRTIAADSVGSESGMLHHYTMDETSESTVHDTVGTLNGTITGAPLWKTGVDNGALELIGSNNFVSLGAGNIGHEPQFTLETWINTSDLSGSKTIFSQNRSGVAANGFWWFIAGDTLKFETYNDKGSDLGLGILSGGTIKAQAWQHVALTRDDKTYRMYLNGDLVSEKSSSSFLDQPNNPNPMLIGANTNGSSYLHFFKGLFDDFCIYNTALDATTINDHYQLGAIAFDVELENGSLQVILDKTPNTTPVQNDIVANIQIIGGMKGKLNVTDFKYDDVDKTLTMKFNPIEPMSSAQIVNVEVQYRGFSVTKSFTVEADLTNQAPQITELKIDGEAQSKGMLKANYRYTDPENNLEGKTIFKWSMADSADGPYTELPGILTKTIVLPASYVGKYLQVEVTPVDSRLSVGETMNATIGPIQAVQGNPNTDWFKDAKYGISHHFISNYINRVAANEEEKWKEDESWDEFLQTFDVKAYAEQVKSSGAGFVILTLGQNSGYLISPNATYDRIANLKPGERTSTRDLPMEIADELAQYGIKMMLYLPSNPPHSASYNEGDYAITKAFDYTPGQNGVPSQKTQEKWQAVIKEWSDRYGEKLAGWWFDGAYYQHAYDDMSKPYNWSSLVNSIKSGNPKSIVSLCSGIGMKMNTPYEDYVCGETNNIGPLPPNGRWIDEANGVQAFALTYLGASDPYWAGWGNKGVSKSTNGLINWVKNFTDLEGVVTLDTKVNRFGEFDPEQLAQLKELKETLKPDTSIPPIVVSSLPVDQGVHGTNVPFIITFDRAIQQGANFDQITLMQETTNVEVSVTIKGNQLMVIPSMKLTAGAAYNLNVPDGAVESLFDIGMEKSYTISFVAKQSDESARAVQHYGFEEGTGTIATDFAGSQDGTIHGAAVWEAGEIGKALSFNGSNTFVDVGKSTIGKEHEFSIEAWINPAAAPGDSMGIIGQQRTTVAPYQFNWYLRNGYLGFAMANETGETFGLDGFTGGTIPVNAWSYVVLTRSENTFTMFVNGQQVAQKTSTAFINQPNNPDNMTIGADWNKAGTGATHLFNGKIDDVKIYNVALDAATVWANYFTTSEVSLTATGDASVIAGETFDVTYTLGNVAEFVYALDQTIHYDPTKVEFVSVDALQSGFSIVGQKEEEGEVRILMASAGAGGAIKHTAPIMKLIFKAKATSQNVTSAIFSTDVAVAGSNGIETTVSNGSAYSIQIIAVDKAALRDLITNAQASHDAAKEGTGIGQYPVGSKATLQAAIDRAKEVAELGGATQYQVDQAKGQLQLALQAFADFVNVAAPGDLNGDGKFSIGDLGLISASYGKTSADMDWDTYKKLDMNGDGKINIVDLAAIASLIMG